MRRLIKPKEVFPEAQPPCPPRGAGWPAVHVDQRRCEASFRMNLVMPHMTQNVLILREFIVILTPNQTFTVIGTLVGP